MRSTLVVAALLLAAFPLYGQDRIEDNSFLVEEAYNQERGIVQHISTFHRLSAEDWEYTFTQEWPFLGQKNQLSYTIPLTSLPSPGGDSRTRVGDVALNYRRQLLGVGGGSVALSPRLTLLLPTGDEASGHGSGGIGVQTNLPLSVLLSDQLVTHYNAGFTLVPSARNPAGDKASTFGFHLGASAIVLVSSSLNLMLEGVYARNQEVVAGDLTDGFEEAFINPGLRYAITTGGGLQIVPGIAYTIGVGPSRGDNGLFLYLSLEHAFRRAGGQD